MGIHSSKEASRGGSEDNSQANAAIKAVQGDDVRSKDKFAELAAQMASEHMSELAANPLLMPTSLSRQKSLERAISGTIADVLNVMDEALPDSDSESDSDSDTSTSSSSLTAAATAALAPAYDSASMVTTQMPSSWGGQANSSFSGFIPSAATEGNMNGTLLEECFGDGLNLFDDEHLKLGKNKIKKPVKQNVAKEKNPFELSKNTFKVMAEHNPADKVTVVTNPDFLLGEFGGFDGFDLFGAKPKPAKQTEPAEQKKLGAVLQAKLKAQKEAMQKAKSVNASANVIKSEPKVSLTPHSMAPLPEGFIAAKGETFRKYRGLDDKQLQAIAEAYVEAIDECEEGEGTGLFAPMAGIAERSVYASKKDSSTITEMKPFMKELTKKLPKHLNADSTACAFVRFDEDRPSFLQAIVTGVAGTPYEHGCFLFDIHCPNDYPNKNPSVTHITPGGKLVKANNGPGGFSPNLHQSSGKVCLSLLGTWNGPGWDKTTCSIYTILSSIMWGIFGQEHPYYNEPGYGGWEGTQPKTGHIDKVYEYDSRVMVGTLKYAIAQMITSPPKGFENVVATHFRAKAAAIRDTMQKWHDDSVTEAYRVELEGAMKEVNIALASLEANAKEKEKDCGGGGGKADNSNK